MKITKQKQKLIDEIAKKYQLRLLLLFGSQADGATHKHSDFDAAYLSRKDLDLMQEGALITDLFGVFECDKVDLANLKIASPLLAHGIFENSQVLYEAEENLYNELSVYAFKRFIENMPLYQLKRERLKELAKSNV